MNSVNRQRGKLNFGKRKELSAAAVNPFRLNFQLIGLCNEEKYSHTQKWITSENHISRKLIEMHAIQ